MVTCSRPLSSALGRKGGVLSFAVMLAFSPVLRADPAEGGLPEHKNAVKSKPLLEIFDEALPEEARWVAKDPDEVIRDSGGYAGKRWAYMHTRDGQISFTGLSIRIGETPQSGEYRYLSFAWRKWGGGQIALQIDRDDTEEGERQRGKLYGYRFDAGEGLAVAGKSLRLSDVPPHQWTEITRDLWQDFGDFTITGFTFISTEGRDAAFDRLYLAKTLRDLSGMPPSHRQLGLRTEDSIEDQTATAAPILPAQVTEPIDPNAVDEHTETPSTKSGPADRDSRDAAPVVLHPDVEVQQVSIDWWNQIMAGGWTMIPLILLSIAGVVISVQRLLTLRATRIAPPELEPTVSHAMARRDVKAALAACDQYPSTLAEALRFVVTHRHNDVQVVNQAAGDIAARDIRDHMSRIYPLSVIGSLAPLLGLLGTIIGMIEAFALVSIYGDEGGSTILSGSISKALITTAAGLVIAIPAIAVYYVIKNRLMRLTSSIEIALERLISSLYLKHGDERETIESALENRAESPNDPSSGGPKSITSGDQPLTPPLPRKE